ncbi:MAG TPA: hypothetical protein VFY65_17495, partial [Longimicrobium sp.]|nr:hypothetical protein [Longimicrobium sp.]
APAPAPAADAATLDRIVADAARPRPIPPQHHLAVMLLMLLLCTASVTLASVVAAFLYLLSGRGTLPDTALDFAFYGAILGFVVGVAACVQYVIQFPTPHRAP